MDLTEEIRDGIISYALDELLHRLRDSDYENLKDDHPELEDLSKEEIEELIVMTAQQYN